MVENGEVYLLNNRAAKIIVFIILVCLIPINAAAYNPFNSVSVDDMEGIWAPVITGVSVVDNPDTELKAGSTGAQLLYNIDFTDINNHWASKYVYKMAARSVIRGYGLRKYGPESPIKRQEIISLLIRIMGREDDVQRQTEGAGIVGDKIIDLWAEGYVDLASRLGIVTIEDNNNWKATATREEVAVWVARVLKLEPVYGTRQQYIYNFGDWKSIDMQNLPYIEAVLQEGIMKGDSSGNFRPLSSIKRSEVAVILYNVAERFDADTDFDTIKGQVLQVSEKNGVTALGIIDMEGNITSIKYLSGDATFPVFRENVIGNHTLIQVGDEITITVNNGEIVYIEVDNKGTIQKGIIQSMAVSHGWNTYLGTVNSVTNRDEWNGVEYVTRPYVRVVNMDGQIFDITTVLDSSQSPGDIPVYINGYLAGIDSLKAGDSIQYGVKDERVYYISVIDNKNEVLRGYFQDQKNGVITFVDYDGTQKDIPISGQTKVIINQRDALLSDLKFGQEIEVISDFGVAKEIEALDFSSAPGYIPSGSKVRTGTIYYISDNRITLQTDTGDTEEFVVSGYTFIYRNAYRSDISQLHLGDHVKIYLDDIYTDVISRLDIANGSQTIESLCKGILDRVSTTNGELHVRDYEYYENGRWVDKDYKVTINVEDDTKIYYKGQKIDLVQLQKQHRGDQIYLAVTNALGSEKAARVVVKDGYETVYKDSIDDINWGTSEIELKSNKNIIVNEGTMIVANNRLIDFGNIKEDFSVEAIVENSDGSKNALLIFVQDIMIDNFSIYVGRFNEVRTDEFDINYYTTLEDNEWGDLEGSSDNETINYDADTVILDVTSGFNVISTSDFFNGDYASDEKYRRDNDYYGFVIANGDRASFVRLSKGGIVKDDERLYDDTLDMMRITAGNLASIDSSIDSIELENARNWSEFYDEWEPADSDVYVNYAKALIIRDNKLIEVEDLNEGDSLYIVRDDSRGLIILVQ